MRERIIIYLLLALLAAGAITFTVALNKGWIDVGAYIMAGGGRRR